ncbi:MAG: SDR family NAD(P)-dependent oxidoreductase [Rhodospirillales bacterium]|nr:SDR family NAD(P)-dependent oxidoreductase [Rhodospirillales bacterium]
MDLGIKGKRAIILGASKGIGFASASALAAEGVDVVLSGSSMERAEAAAAKITDGKVVPMVGDVSNPDNMNTLYEDAKKALGGPIDILFNNHGGPAVGAALDLDEAELISEFNKMVVSIIRLTGLCVPDMIAQKWGRIIAVGSSGVVQPIPNMVLSNTLRASTVYYMKTLANEVIKEALRSTSYHRPKF